MVFLTFLGSQVQLTRARSYCAWAGTAEEDRELFTLLDTDGGGTLTSKELMAAMKTLVTESKSRAGLVANKKRAVDEARKAAEEAQAAAVPKMVMN